MSRLQPSPSSSSLPSFGRKYAALAPELLDRVWREACAIERRPAEALKRAKRALHQLHSAFVQERELDVAERKLGALAADASDESITATCRAILECHASTRERLATMAALHRELRERIGVPQSVLDLGCGLHPFALPWMELPRGATYHAREADGRMVALIAQFFERVGQAGSAATIDLVGDGEPLPRADVALLFKLLPTLERQRKGAAGRLLDRLDVRVAVLSFPTRSLGARAKGMESHYADFAEALLATRRWPCSHFELGNELFFVAHTNPAACSGNVPPA